MVESSSNREPTKREIAEALRVIRREFTLTPQQLAQLKEIAETDAALFSHLPEDPAVVMAKLFANPRDRRRIEAAERRGVRKHRAEQNFLRSLGGKN